VPLPADCNAAGVRLLVRCLHGLTPLEDLELQEVHDALEAAELLGAEGPLAPALLDHLASMIVVADSADALLAGFSPLLTAREARASHVRAFARRLVRLFPSWPAARACLQRVEGWQWTAVEHAADLLTQVFHPALVFEALSRLPPALENPPRMAALLARVSHLFHPREGLLYADLLRRTAGGSAAQELRPLFERCLDLPENAMRASMFAFVARRHVSLLVQLPDKRPVVGKLTPWFTLRVLPVGRLRAEVKRDDLVHLANTETCAAALGAIKVQARLMPYVENARQNRILDFAEAWHELAPADPPADPCSGRLVLDEHTLVHGARAAFSAALDRAALLRVDLFFGTESRLLNPFDD